MKFILFNVIATASFVGAVCAEVVPVTLVTGRGDGSPEGIPSGYTVPDGKVLIVEGVTYSNIGGSLGIPATLSVGFSEAFDNAPTVRRLVFVDLGANRGHQLHSFDPPVRLKAGSSLTANRIQGFYTWRGLLVDQGDLFAQLDVDLLNPRIEGAQLTADAKVSSARPHRLVVEKSAALSTFAPDAQGKVTATPDPKVSVVSVPADDPKKFMRVVAEVRP